MLITLLEPTRSTLQLRTARARPIEAQGRALAAWSRVCGEPVHGKARVVVVPQRGQNRALRIDAEIEALVARAVHQSFVPIIDDRQAFIGIVRRQQNREAHRPPQSDRCA